MALLERWLLLRMATKREISVLWFSFCLQLTVIICHPHQLININMEYFKAHGTKNVPKMQAKVQRWENGGS